VEVAPAIKGSIRVIVNADAVLFPREQANIVPKISAPIRRFLVNRGDHVKAGQLLAELENTDLVGAAQESRGQFVQAESNLRATTGAGVPEQVTKAQSDVDAARQTLEAAKTLLDSRQQLFKEGALAHKQVDEAQVQYAQAKAVRQRDGTPACAETVGKGGAAPRKRRSSCARPAHHRAAMASYAEIRSPLTASSPTGRLSRRDGHDRRAARHPPWTCAEIVARINMAQDQRSTSLVGAAATMTPADGSEP
jgi:multidrug efflux pump subunit AcrA (membrane-fusion protein)